MALVHNALRRVSELQRAAKVTFGLDAGESGVERLSESVVINRDMWAIPEDAFLRGERRCAGGYGPAAGGAGFYGAVALRPITEGIIVVVRGVWIQASGAQSFQIRNQAPALTSTSTVKCFLDNRIQGSTPTALVQYKNGDAVIPGLTAFIQLTTSAAGMTWVPLNYVSAYGMADVGIVVTCVTANTAFGAWFEWTERNMVPGEIGR